MAALVPIKTAAPEDGDEGALGGDLRGAQLAGLDLRGRDLTGRDLSGANLGGANLSGADLSGAILRDATLTSADLTGAHFVGSDLRGADLSEARCERASFGRANLADAILFNAELTDSSLISCSLVGADLRTATLAGARLHGADMTRADLTRANLRGADLTECIAGRSCFDDVDLRRARVKRMRGFEQSSWIGADILDVDFTGAYAMRRLIMDQNFLDEMRRRSRYHAVLYWLWWLTSDCGRSFARWGAWTAVLAVGFAFAYQFVGVDYGAHETRLSSFYFSVVTLTTLGYGDVLPASEGAQILAMVEVVLGYVMLGGLLSIFSTKMARRAD